jgi:hypothetical protein
MRICSWVSGLTCVAQEFECGRTDELRVALGGLYVMKQTPQKGQAWSYFEDVGDVEVCARSS